jgi:hypothetical protein
MICLCKQLISPFSLLENHMTCLCKPSKYPFLVILLIYLELFGIIEVIKIAYITIKISFFGDSIDLFEIFGYF